MAAVDGTSVVPPKGRGRGRGFATNLKKPGAETKKDLSIKDCVKQLVGGEIQTTFDYITKSLPREQKILDEVVSEVCSTALKETDFAEKAASFLHKFWLLDESSDYSIRKPLLMKIQSLYKARDELLDDDFQCYTALLCEIFSNLKIQDQPLKALVNPVFTILNELLLKAEKSLDCLLTFHDLVLKHGHLLQTQDKAKMSDMINFIRNASFETKNRIHQCIFLEIIELNSCDWKMEDDVTMFYSDKLSELIERDG